MKTLLAFLLMLSVDASAQTVWATTNSSGAVTGFYANAAPSPTPPNCCTQMDMSDARIKAFLTPAPTPTAVYASALAAGISITSAGTPALNAVYATTTQAQNNVAGIAAGIASGQGLPHGAATINWPDAAGGLHAFTSAQFMAFADALRNYVYDLGVAEATLGAGGTAAWPSASATIP